MRKNYILRGGGGGVFVMWGGAVGGRGFVLFSLRTGLPIGLTESEAVICF